MKRKTIYWFVRVQKDKELNIIVTKVEREVVIYPSYYYFGGFFYLITDHQNDD